MGSKTIVLCLVGLAVFVATAAAVMGADATRLTGNPDLIAVLVAGCAGVVAIGGATAVATAPRPTTTIAGEENAPGNVDVHAMTLLVRRIRSLEEELAALRNASSTTEERLALLERIPAPQTQSTDRQVALLHSAGMPATDIASRLQMDGAETRLRMHLLDARNEAPEEQPC